MTLHTQSATENFDHLAPQTIVPSNPLVLDQFRLELPLGGEALIRPTEDDDELASGMVLAAPDYMTLAHVVLHFNQSWERLTLSLVMPPTNEPDIQSMFALYGKDETSTFSNATLFWHGTDRRRVRVELLRNAEGPFQRAMLHLLRGAYVDNIRVDPSRDATALANAGKPSPLGLSRPATAKHASEKSSEN